MLMDCVRSIKTNGKLLDAVQRVATYKLSSAELIEQKVSFVYGSMNSNNGVTKEKVRQVILGQVGATEELAK